MPISMVPFTLRDQELERGAHSTGTKGLSGILAQMPVPVYIQIKKSSSVTYHFDK